MKLNDFLPHLLVELPGVSDPLAHQTLLRVAIDFCQRTQVWRDISEPQPLLEGVSEYDLEAPTDARVFLLRDVWVGRRQLRPITLQRLQLELPSNPALGAPEPSRYRASLDRQSLTVYPVPRNVTGSLALLSHACFVPKPAATTLPDLLADRFLLPVCAGVKATLMAMPGQPWSNPGLSAFYRAQCDDGVVAAQIEAFYDTATGGDLRVAPRAFGF